MLKRNWITEAVERGIFFEMNYSQALDGEFLLGYF